MKSCVFPWNNALYQQPYLLSCTSFDVWNYDTSNVVYIVSLVVSAWFLPLIVITKCYSKACLRVIISCTWFELNSFRLELDKTKVSSLGKTLILDRKQTLNVTCLRRKNTYLLHRQWTEVWIGNKENAEVCTVGPLSVKHNKELAFRSGYEDN